MSIRTHAAALVRTAARALASAMRRKPLDDETDGYEAWLRESFAR